MYGRTYETSASAPDSGTGWCDGAARVRVEHLGTEADPLIGELLGELRTHTGRLQRALVLTVLVDAGVPIEEEHVLQGDDVTLHALHLGDVRDATAAVTETADLHDEI